MNFHLFYFYLDQIDNIIDNIIEKYHIDNIIEKLVCAVFYDYIFDFITHF